jgi:hypothetical protein
MPSEDISLTPLAARPLWRLHDAPF